jgi:hypothetical protein
LLLQEDNKKLVRLLAQLKKELHSLKRGDPEQLKLQIAGLEQQLATRNKMLFGDKSEKCLVPRAMSWLAVIGLCMSCPACNLHARADDHRGADYGGPPEGLVPHDATYQDGDQWFAKGQLPSSQHRFIARAVASLRRTSPNAYPLALLS